MKFILILLTCCVSMYTNIAQADVTKGSCTFKFPSERVQTSFQAAFAIYSIDDALCEMSPNSTFVFQDGTSKADKRKGRMDPAPTNSKGFDVAKIAKNGCQFTYMFRGLDGKLDSSTDFHEKCHEPKKNAQREQERQGTQCLDSLEAMSGTKTVHSYLYNFRCNGTSFSVDPNHAVYGSIYPCTSSGITSSNTVELTARKVCECLCRQ